MLFSNEIFNQCAQRETNQYVFIGSLNGHENRVTSITIAPSGLALVSASWDQYVRVWG